VESSGAYLARFPGGFGLPRYYGESASTWQFSGPARRSLALRPAWTTDLHYEAFSQSASGHSLPPDPPRVFPAGARVCRPGFSPGRMMCLGKAHIITSAKARNCPIRVCHSVPLHTHLHHPRERFMSASGCRRFRLLSAAGQGLRHVSQSLSPEHCRPADTQLPQERKTVDLIVLGIKSIVRKASKYLPVIF